MAITARVTQGCDKEPPDQWLIGNGRRCANGDPLQVDDLHGLPQKGLAAFPGGPVLQEHMQGKKVLVLRVNAVGRKAAAQSVGAVVHGAHTLYDLFSGHTLSVSGYNGGNGAAGRDAYLAFHFIHKISSYKNKKTTEFCKRN